MPHEEGGQHSFDFKQDAQRVEALGSPTVQTQNPELIVAKLRHIILAGAMYSENAPRRRVLGWRIRRLSPASFLEALAGRKRLAVIRRSRETPAFWKVKVCPNGRLSGALLPA